MNNPNNILWVLGTNGLSFLMDQERKHWLLKTDKNIETQDDVTGDVFHGQLDNQGSRIVIESAKTPKKKNVLSEIQFADAGLNEILSPAYSAFTYNTSVNGLLFARINSIGYMFNETVREKNYRLEFTNAEEIMIPFAASHVSGDVYATRWIKTTIAPTMSFVGASETKRMTFNPNVTGVTYYYPLDSSMHILDIENTGEKTYVTEVVNSEAYIGYPLFWFTCDNSNIGPTTKITNNKSIAGKTIMHLGNAGNESPYVAKCYFGIDGDMDATPDDDSTSVYWLRVYAKTGSTFTNAQGDYDIPLDPSKIELVSTSTGEKYMLSLDDTNISKITMDDTINWDYVDGSNMYEIPLLVYDSNCYNVARQSLNPALKVYFDTSIPFTVNVDNDMGYAGVQMSAALSNDQTAYPYDLHKWDGIPEHLQNAEEDGTTPQHLALYAMHNTPFYSEDIPTSRQTAALLLDPGKPADNNTGELDDEERGRVYLLSNDEAIYENNATLEHPKPARTAARICDIPTSVTQFMNVHGIAPVSVVDKEYVRSEASFTAKDIERLYNTLGNTMIKPTMFNAHNIPIYDPEDMTNYPEQDNKFVFASLDYLNEIDLLNPHNDVRLYENLTPLVDVDKVSVYRIVDGGEKYVAGDIGMTIIGGSALEYVVDEIGVDGRVTSVSIHGVEAGQKIHLSNFNLSDMSTGYTAPFGTARSTGIGAGLKLAFSIDNYGEIKTKLGRIKDDLFALVEDPDGLYLYGYLINQTTAYGDGGKWVKQHIISKYDNSTSDKTKGGASVTDAFLNTTIPSFKPIEVITNNGTDILKTISTGSMINIIDTEHTPLQVSGDNIDGNTYVDLCGWAVTPLVKATSERYKDDTSVLDYIKKYNLGMFDSYLLWRWENTNDTMNKNFEYCFVYRKMNNYLNTDSTTLIPTNNLIHNSYVNTNPNTTIVWDVPNAGVMMWVYSPSYNRHETYHIDQETGDIRIGYANEIPGKKSELRWSDLFVKDINGDTIGIVDGEGRLKFNIMTNSMVDNVNNIDVAERENIYEQPDYTRLDGKLTFGKNESTISGPRGNWRLVFPQVNIYTIQDEGSGVNNIGLKLRLMDVTKTTNIVFDKDKPPVVITDANGNRVNSKCVILNETQTGTDMMIYNNTLDEWIKV